uniref:Secreted protein n=1 Tax=Romanomermis culicivorax TaxID=13658 RepID=A0A915L4Z6_ROMCU
MKIGMWLAFILRGQSVGVFSLREFVASCVLKDSSHVGLLSHGHEWNAYYRKNNRIVTFRSSSTVGYPVQSAVCYRRQPGISQPVRSARRHSRSPVTQSQI